MQAEMIEERMELGPVSVSESGSRVSRSCQFRHLPWLLCALLLACAGIRLLGITRPLLGDFATKNVVYAMIARNWAEGRADLWHPTLDCLRGGKRAWHMVEFPVSAYVAGGCWWVFGGSLDVWGRGISVLFSVVSVALMVGLVARWHGVTAGAGAGVALTLSPISIIYGQSFTLEASLVCLTLLTFWALDRWLAGGHGSWLVVANTCLALLLLTKIYMVVLLLPLVGMVRASTLAMRRWAWLSFGLAVVPAATWYAFAYQTAAPDGPHAERIFYSVRQSAETHRPPHPLLRTADFYRQILDNLAGVVLTPIGLTLMLVGFLDRQWRRSALWLVAMIALVLLLPKKFQEMNYYYMAVLPPLCILVGIGWRVVRERLQPGTVATAAVLVIASVFSLRHAFRPAFVSPAEDRAVVTAAQAIRSLTDEDEPVATMHGTTIDLLYYCDRAGWAVEAEKSGVGAAWDEYRRQGARYLVVVGGEVAALKSVVKRGEGFRVFSLGGEEENRR